MAHRASPAPRITTVDVPERSRYEGVIDGSSEEAVVAYTLENGVMTFTHTEVPEALEGQGVGSALVRYALDDARKRGLRVIPHCPFVGGFIRKHPEYADLLAR